MNKYKVKVVHVFSEIFDVEAEDKEGAKQKVVEIFNTEDFQNNAQYENTIPPEHWAVASEEEYQEMIKTVEAQLAKENKEESNIITP
jgi:hypothetical protein